MLQLSSFVVLLLGLHCVLLLLFVLVLSVVVIRCCCFCVCLFFFVYGAVVSGVVAACGCVYVDSIDIVCVVDVGVCCDDDII